MKRIALSSLVLALGLIIVQPLQADTIAYTITGSFSGGGYVDPLGVGSGSATAIINFTLAPTPVSGDTISGESWAYYTPGGLTLTLSGTNADGTYTNMTTPAGKFNTNPVFENFNFFSTSISTNDFLSPTMYVTIAGVPYKFNADISVPLSFWSDSDVPPLPKLMGQSDNLTPRGTVGPEEFNVLDQAFEATYGWTTLQVTSTVVPLPPTVWLLGSGLLGLVGWRRFKKS